MLFPSPLSCSSEEKNLEDQWVQNRTQVIYKDEVLGKKDDRPGLMSCLKALRKGDVLVVWKLDRLGRNLRHLMNIVQDLADKDITLKVLSGQGADVEHLSVSNNTIHIVD